LLTAAASAGVADVAGVPDTGETLFVEWVHAVLIPANNTTPAINRASCFFVMVVTV
jgi:hypothetical protein